MKRRDLRGLLGMAAAAAAPVMKLIPETAPAPAPVAVTNGSYADYISISDLDRGLPELNQLEIPPDRY